MTRPQTVGAWLLLFFAPFLWAADYHKPFVLAAVETDPQSAVLLATEDKLVDAGFRIVGRYAPYPGTTVLMVTSNVLTEAAAQTERGAYAAVVRVAVAANEEAQTEVSFNNPVYMAAAYRLDTDLKEVRDTLSDTLGFMEDFGSKKGLTGKKLRKYHYMFGMERFDDPYVLGEFSSHEDALSAVRSGLIANTVGLASLYELALPREETVLFGVSMQGPTDDDRYYDDSYQLSIVDFQGFASAAYLPYEIVVRGNRVEALHMRFRMAVHFPDLSMMGKHSFMTLRPSPAAIQKALEAVVAAKQE
jgi:hypothetical protein